MQKRYSRLWRTEEKRNIRRSIIYSILTIAFLVFFFFLGLPSLAKFSAFLSDLRSSSIPPEKEDLTPPVPPRFDPLPEATSELSVDIKGYTEPGVNVFLKLNNKEEEILANSEGQFTYSFSLNDGENKISSYAVDSSGNESQKTDVITIIYDNDPPELTISNPEDQANFYGAKQRQVVIQGQTEEDSKLNINGRIVVVESEGFFTFTTTLSEGENKFDIKTEDNAENITEKTFTLHFSP
jgi:hypothetical protein